MKGQNNTPKENLKVNTDKPRRCEITVSDAELQRNIQMMK
jgi:hypothetical protein